VAASTDPLIRQQMQNQEQLFMTRRSLLRSDLQSIEESIQGQEALLQAYKGMLENRRSQLRLINEELGHLRGLVKEGYAPRNRQLEMERMVADSSTAIADLQGNTVRARRAIGELRQRALSRQQEYRKEVETQLADVSREVLGDNEKMRAVTDDLAAPRSRRPRVARWWGWRCRPWAAWCSRGKSSWTSCPRGRRCCWKPMWRRT
jgi:protease secretion system membrane fusion protein